MSGREVSRVTADDSLGLLDNLLTLGKDELDVAGVGHVRVDLYVMLVTVARFRRFVLVIGTVRFGNFNIRDRGHGKSVGAAWGPG